MFNALNIGLTVPIDEHVFVTVCKELHLSIRIIKCQPIGVSSLSWIKKQRQKEKAQQVEHDLTSLPAIYIYEVWSEPKAQGNISLTWYKLERLQKTDTIGGSYSLAGSFRGWPAPISHLAGTLRSPTPSGLNYDGDAHFATAATRAAKSGKNKAIG